MRLRRESSRAYLARLEAHDRATATAFRGALDDAPPGTYFRTLVKAIDGSAPFGQPIDFKRQALELARLEQRIADLEAAS